MLESKRKEEDSKKRQQKIKSTITRKKVQETTPKSSSEDIKLTKEERDALLIKLEEWEKTIINDRAKINQLLTSSQSGLPQLKQKIATQVNVIQEMSKSIGVKVNALKYEELQLVLLKKREILDEFIIDNYSTKDRQYDDLTQKINTTRYYLIDNTEKKQEIESEIKKISDSIQSIATQIIKLDAAIQTFNDESVKINQELESLHNTDDEKKENTPKINIPNVQKEEKELNKQEEESNKQEEESNNQKEESNNQEEEKELNNQEEEPNDQKEENKTPVDENPDEQNPKESIDQKEKDYEIDINIIQEQIEKFKVNVSTIKQKIKSIRQTLLEYTKTEQRIENLLKDIGNSIKKKKYPIGFKEYCEYKKEYYQLFIQRYVLEDAMSVMEISIHWKELEKLYMLQSITKVKIDILRKNYSDSSDLTQFINASEDQITESEIEIAIILQEIETKQIEIENLKLNTKRETLDKIFNKTDDRITREYEILVDKSNIIEKNNDTVTDFYISLKKNLLKSYKQKIETQLFFHKELEKELEEEEQNIETTRFVQKYEATQGPTQEETYPVS